jgi:hypothetical protein
MLRLPPQVSASGKLRKIGEFAKNHRFDVIGGFQAAFLLEITPDLYEVAGCLRRQDIARLPYGCDFSRSK